MASFSVFGSYLIIETSQEWGRILWNPWQCNLKLKYMKNPSFGALHSPFPSQSEMQGRKPKEEIQQPVFLHGYAKISHSMRNQEEEQLQDWVKDNFAHYAKFRTPWETTRGSQRNFLYHAKFRMVCKIFLCTDSVRFLS